MEQRLARTWRIALAACVALAGSAQAVALTPLDVASVTTAGAAVTALVAGHHTSGGFIQNPPGATTNLCINQIGIAATTAGGNTTCIPPGATYELAANSGAVSVVSSDPGHAFSGYGYQ